MADVFRLLTQAPTAARLLVSARAAAKGDEAAIAYLKSDGYAEALDLLRPGTGSAARLAVDQAQSASAGIRAAVATLGGELPGEYIDGEYSVLEDGAPPWSAFLRSWLRLGYGGNVILGGIGSGKTALALRMAQRLADQLGYEVEAINLYGDDCPEWATTVSSRVLIKRMKRLKRYLDSLAMDDEEDSDDWDAEEDNDPKELKDSRPATLPAGGKVIVIDEASLTMSHSANDPARRAAIQALMQCRHLGWVVIYIGQQASQIPLQVLQQAVLWVKKPSGDESDLDRDNPFVRQLWRLAQEAHADAQRSPWYVDPWRDWRAWAYCYCRSLAGGPGYQGLLPFSMPEG